MTGPERPKDRSIYGLRGKVAVVTGGATGIGAATARLFALSGATVFVLDIDIDPVAEAPADGDSGPIHAIRTDVSSQASVQSAIGQVLHAAGRIDVLHANAGIEWTKPALQTTFEEWRRVIGVNLDGVFLSCREAITSMLRVGRGAVVITSSPHAERTVPDAAAYAASKGGSLALMRALALECAGKGVRVNAVLPGAVDTPMLRREAEVASDPGAQMSAFARMQPLNRLGRPEEVAEAVVFLASDLSRFTTGSCLYVDGGASAALPAGPPLPYGSD
jgi:NAD(P)-dependent dehydrogenase (short-subunit alcohol dehydrogenase family)